MSRPQRIDRWLPDDPLRAWSGAAVRSEFRHLAAEAGVRRSLRRISCAARMRSNSPRDGLALNIIHRQLGHANLATTSSYLQGIDPRRHHRHRPHAPGADDVRQRRPAALIESPSAVSRSAPALLHRLGGASADPASVETITARPSRVSCVPAETPASVEGAASGFARLVSAAPRIRPKQKRTAARAAMLVVGESEGRIEPLCDRRRGDLDAGAARPCSPR